jgi:hypothetical protein
VLLIDTGCTDQTIPVAQMVCDELGLPLTLLEEPWVGHAHNRSILLERVRETGVDYCLMMDADMELSIEGELPVFEADEYMLPIRDRGLVYPLPLLTATRRAFRYEGVAHSYLACDGPIDGVILNQLVLIDHGGGGHRPGKIERDAELLAEAVAKDPTDARSWFYLAQSYRDLDQIPKAIAAYKVRATLGGWPEEVYQALYQAGMLMCEHVNYYEGAKLLIAAADLKHNRAEALRALAGCTKSVADKVPLPHDEVLFVEPGAYTAATAAPPLAPAPPVLTAEQMPPFPDLAPRCRRRRKGAPITPAEITAIIVTRGNVDLAPCLETLPYDQVIVWDNSQREHDYKIFGRYAAIPEARHPVIYWQDDDVIFRHHDELLKHYQPGVLIANMDDDWRLGAGYNDDLVLFGAGSLCDAHLPSIVFDRYLQQHPWDDELLVEADFAFGVLAPWVRVNIPFEVRPFSDEPGRLWNTEGQTSRKWNMIQRAKDLQTAAA